MNTINNFSSEESRSRAAAALAFYSSQARKLYSGQRIKNDKDDLSLSIVTGIKKLQGERGQQIIASLTSDD